MAVDINLNLPIDTTPTNGSTNFIDSNAVFDGLAGKDSHIESAKKNHKFVAETISRVSESSYTYTGSEVTVGSGGTYSTLSAAITGISTGQVIRFLDGTYLSTSEPSGYFLINDSTKSYKVTGNPNDRTSVVLSCPTLQTYLLRVRLANNVTFENLTIDVGSLMFALTINMSIVAGSPVNVKFKNCVIKSSAPSVSAYNLIEFNGNPLENGNFEFVDCEFQTNGNINSSVFVVVDLTNAEMTSYNLPIFFKRCNFKGIVNVIGNLKLIMYDCYQNIDLNTVAFKIGTDSAVTAYTLSNLDIRGCRFIRGENSNQHGVLLSRGVNFVVFQNNYIYKSGSDNNSNIGLVIKSIAASHGDVDISGNFIEYPRPLYLKGAKKCLVHNNTTYSNFDNSIIASGFGVELNSALEESSLFVSENNIYKNNFIGKDSAIGISTLTTQTILNILTTNYFYDNQYGCPVDLYTNNPASSFDDRINNVGLVDVNSTFYII